MSRKTGKDILSGFFNNFHNWLIAFIVVITMDFLFTMLGFTWGFQEGNPLIVWFLKNNILYFPFLSGIGIFIMFKIMEKYLWEKKAVRVMLWLEIPLHFYITSILWYSLLN